MRILLIMDPGILIPVKGYGGIERIIEMLAKEYLRLGHEVHLLVTDGSDVPGCIIHGYGKEGFPPNKWDARRAVPFVWQFLRKHKNNFDLVHNFGRLVYLLPILNHAVKKIMSYQREVTSRNIRIVHSLPNKNLFFTGCSQNLVNRVNIKGEWEAIYNGCNFSDYQLTENLSASAPLVFLGRIEEIKGCHTAIQVAKAGGHNLIIAGNISSLPEEKKYYEEQILPLIDGNQIQYIGTVNDVQKNELLGKAKALLFPIEWEEPFGIVMVEAMACGTPVIGLTRGSVSEVIDEGITGFKVQTLHQMIAAVKNVHQISRASCRAHAQVRFDAAVIAMQYLNMVSGTRKRVVILSTHQPTANPRATKEYETLKRAGYKVKHLYSYNADWSYKIDEQKFTLGLMARQDFIEVGKNPHKQPMAYFLSRIMYKVFRSLSSVNNFCRQMSTSRVTFYYRNLSRRYPADLYIAHYLGCLPAGVNAAKNYKAKVLFDAEDFHRGEQSYFATQVENIIAIETKYLPLVNAITTASNLISREYQKLFPQQNIITVNNVFSKKFLQPRNRKMSSTLRLFWFSQNIGNHRGLEIFVQALNLLCSLDITLTIMGNRRSASYEEELLSLSQCPHKIIFKDPVRPEDVFTTAAGYDIGLAGEVPNCYNKEICLSNKIFAYLLAGNCILASDMQGQVAFMSQNPHIGLIYKYNDPQDLANKIELLNNDRELLEGYKSQSRALAGQKMNWEEENKQWKVLIDSFL